MATGAKDAGKVHMATKTNKRFAVRMQGVARYDARSLSARCHAGHHARRKIVRRNFSLTGVKTNGASTTGTVTFQSFSSDIQYAQSILQCV